MTLRRKLCATTALIAVGVFPLGSALAQAPIQAGASGGPQGGAVTAGAASIAQNARQTVVNQSSAKAVVEWRRFDVEAGSSVQFVQPGRDSVTLNRVREGDASRIDGAIGANGQVYLVNPNGVLIGPGGRINAAGFVASTHDIRDQDFMAGKMEFNATSPNPSARVRNEGVIAAADGGYAVLAGSRVENAGTITARVGQVGLAGGDGVALDVVGDRLLQFQVTKPVSRDPGAALITNTGTLSAPGGVVTLSAQAARTVIRDVINTTGVIEAQGATVEGGRVIIHGGDAGVVQVGGRVDVSNANGVGGTVEIRGEKVGLVDGARVDASGAAGGGSVLVGGDWQGKGPGNGLGVNAQVAFVAPTASIKVDATKQGDGGKAVVWADDTTRFNGTISAQGGLAGGDGGRVETSGKRTLTVAPDAVVNTAARAPKAKAGSWLLDPTDVTIQAGGVSSIVSPYSPASSSTVAPSAITAALALGSVTIQTSGGAGGSGDISVLSPVAYSGAASSLILQADRDILLSSAITSSAAPLNVTLTAARRIVVSADVTTLGGSFTANANSGGIGGSVGGYAQTAGNVSAGAGAISITGRAATSGFDGVSLTGGSLTTTSGAIAITGLRGGGTAARNVLIDAAVVSAGSGAITITGTSTAGGAGDGNHGVLIQNAATVSTVGGALSISGTGANLAGSAQPGQDGVMLVGANTLVQTDSGSITLVGASSYVGVQSLSEGVHVMNSAVVLATGTGAITVTGTATATVDAGIFVESNGVIATNGSGALSLNGFSTSSGGGLVVWATGRVGAASATGPLTLTADTMFLESGGTPGTIQGGGALVIQPSTASTSIGIAGGAGTLNLSAISLSAIADGFSSRRFGRLDGTGAVIVNAVASPDAIDIRGGSITIAGALTTAGADAITIAGSRTVAINDNVTVTGAGAITISANSGGVGDGVGLALATGKKIASGGGDIQLTGTGGAAVAGDGVAISGTVATTGTGAITMTGARGAATLNETNRNVYVGGGLISTAAGSIAITGTSAAGDGFRGHGVFIDASSTVATTGGAITMTGTRGAGDNSHNVVIRGPNTVVSTTGAGSVSLIGTSVAGGGGAFSFGVLVDQGGTVATVGGAITLTGRGAASAFDGQMGVALRGGVSGAVVQTATGAITVTGDGGAASTGSLSDGVRVDDFARMQGLSSGASITIAGTGNAGGSQGVTVLQGTVTVVGGGTLSIDGSNGIAVSTNSIIGSGASALTGGLTLTANALTIDATSTLQGQGALTIQPKATSTSIGVAGGAGTLDLSTALLARIAGTFSSRTFGRTDGTGAVVVNAHASPDSIALYGGSITIAGALTTAGADGITIGGNGGVAINDNVTTSGAGAITIAANATGLGTGVGVALASGKQIASAGGDIQITGTGGSASGGDGVAINGGTVATTGAGAITLTGSRGATTLDETNRNVYLSAAVLSTNAGAITITGTSTSGSGMRGHGVYVNANSTIGTTGGAITITGARGGGANSHNVVIRGANTVVSTTGTGAITLTGTSSAGGAGDFSFGVLVDQGGTVTTAGGALTLNGVGAAAAFNGQFGVALRAGVGPAIVQTSTGAITVTGASSSSTGVLIDGNSRVLGLAAGSSISIAGAGGPGSYGAHLLDGTASVIGGGALGIDGPTITLEGASLVGSTAHTGALTLTADTINAIGASFAVQGQGALTIRPKTTTTSIGVAGGAGTLNLSTALLGQIAGTFASRTFGRSDGTGLVTINAHASPDALTVRGGGITVAGALSTSGADSLTLAATGSAIFNADATTVTGALSVTGDASGLGGTGIGVLVNSGFRVASSGGAVTVTGLAPTGGTDGVAVLGGTIATTGAGTLTVTGTRTAGAITGRNIVISGAGARVTTQAGALALVGTSTVGGAVANSMGVQIEQGAVVSTDSAALSIYGTGSASTLQGQTGVGVRTGASVQSNTGAISIQAMGGANAAVIESEGLFVGEGSRIRGIVNGSSITVSAGARAGFSAGTYMTNGTIEVAGAGATTIDSNQAIFITSNSYIGKVGATSPLTLISDSISMYQPAGGGTPGTIAGAGSLTIQPKTVSTAITIGGAGGAGGLDLQGITLAQILDGFSSRTIGRTDGTGLVTVNAHATPDSLTVLSGGNTGDISVSGALTASGGNTLTLRAGRKVTLNTGGNVTSSTSGTAVVIANGGFAGASFVNISGSGAVSAPNGRWLIYSADPTADSVGGLDATAGTQFSKTYAANLPATITDPGNYLIYSVSGVGAAPPPPPAPAPPPAPVVVAPPPPVVVPPPVVEPPVVVTPVVPPVVTPTVTQPTPEQVAAQRDALITAALQAEQVKTFQAQLALASVIRGLPQGSATEFLTTPQAQQAIVDAAGKGVSALSPDLVGVVVNVLGGDMSKMMPPPPPVVAAETSPVVQTVTRVTAPPALTSRIPDAPSFAQVGPSFNAASLLSSIGDIGSSFGSIGSLSGSLSSGAASFGGAGGFSSAPAGVAGAAGGMTGAVFSAPSTVSVIPDDADGGASGGGAQRERTGLGAPSSPEEGENMLPGVLKSFGGQGGRGGNRSPYNTPFFVPLQNEVLRD